MRAPFVWRTGLWAFCWENRAEYVCVRSRGNNLAMLRFLYTTDLHGDPRAYRRLPELCREHGVSLIVNGGDMLPKGRDMLAEQSAFLGDAMPRFLARCAELGVRFYGLFGNDDLCALHENWLDLVNERVHVHDLAEHWHELPGGEGWWIGGNSFVPDYPFGLKDWCLRDAVDARPMPTRSRPVISSREGFRPIDDPVAFFASRPTLQEHLDALIDPAVPMERAIFVSHPPPAGLGLGTLWSGEDVGSKSVRAWVERHRPLLTLSGHIHESPEAEERRCGLLRHTAMCGPTTCHQPGQMLPRRLTYSIIELDGDAPERVRIAWMHDDLSGVRSE